MKKNNISMINNKLWWILFVICVLISLYFIFSLVYWKLKDYKIIEPYFYSDVSLIYNKEEIDSAINYMITNISNDISDISNNFYIIQDTILNPTILSSSSGSNTDTMNQTTQLSQSGFNESASVGNQSLNQGKKLKKSTGSFFKKKKKRRFKF